MNLRRDWIRAVLAGLLVLVVMLAAVEALAAYGGRPIVNNPPTYTHTERNHP